MEEPSSTLQSLKEARSPEDKIAIINHIKDTYTPTKASLFLVEFLEYCALNERSHCVLQYAADLIPLLNFIPDYAIPSDPDVLKSLRLHFNITEAMDYYSDHYPADSFFWINDMDSIRLAYSRRFLRVNDTMYSSLNSMYESGTISPEFTFEFIRESLNWELPVSEYREYQEIHNCRSIINLFNEFFSNEWRSQRFTVENLWEIPWSTKMKKIDRMHGCNCVLETLFSAERAFNRHPPL